ncbi:unnamed protein product [Bursaphelenchus xylophilus]|uniref:(pine wood nematode) hypothetical protein n=1 Tax=Bursaphelenchus xylophilus TaxID=6326 RepID=A0A1I7RZI1_BURXY|nr:unnamed protein product [Bursaphelenchus xylophilus]CAG9111248.1 unnamed protein product [Bursaphelenchus xylophilus]
MRIRFSWLLVAVIAMLGYLSHARPHYLSRAEHKDQRYNRLVPYTVFLPRQHRFSSNFFDVDSSSFSGLAGHWRRANNDDEDPLRFG